MNDSRIIQWYNEVADPTTLGSGDRIHSSISPLLDQCFETLPVNLESLLLLLPYEADEFLKGNIIERLIITIFNEEDERIANFSTKQQVMDLLFILLSTSRHAKTRLRLSFERMTTWIDDIIPGEEPTETQKEDLTVLTHLMKVLFIKVWNMHSSFSDYYLKDPSYSLETTKIELLRQYTAIQMQAVVRSFLQRRNLHHYLQNQKDNQLVEIQKWSVVTIQKVARGFLARKKTIPEFQIRKALTKEVLRITESFLTKHHNLWQFLKEINEEIVYYQKELQYNVSREDNWAKTFVERVIKQRENEFEAVWDEFPRAMESVFNNPSDSYQKKSLNKPKDTMVGSLMPFESHAAFTAATATTTSPKALQTTTTTTAATTSNREHNSNKSSKSKTKKMKQDGSQHEITVEEVHLATSLPTPHSTGSGKGKGGIVPGELGGPLIRKALQRTVTKEVTTQLNQLMSGTFHSRKLSNDIRSVYEPESIYTPLPQLKSSSKQGKHKNSLSTSAPTLNTSNSNKLLVPINMKEMNARKTELKKAQKASMNMISTSLDGTTAVSKPKGTINQANTIDWISSSSVHNNIPLEESNGKVVQPGNTLLLDIPQGFNDTIERLFHAAALRCYIPPFFQGIEHTEDPKATKKQQNDAYEMYLALPLGLAKMKYELECKGYAQKYINQLRIQGMQYINDVIPLSKFVMCMKNVETPNALMQKVIELFVDLKNMKSFQYNDSTTATTVAVSSSPTKRSSSSSEQHKKKKEKDNNSPQQQHMRTDLSSMDPLVDLAATTSITNTNGNSTQQQDTRNQIQIAASKMLQDLLENIDADDENDAAAWCSLTCNLEEFFIHAAFLIIPHKSQQHQQQQIKHNEEEEEEEELGNHCFKQYAQELLTLPHDNEQAKANLIQSRFRACMIYITPYVLYLKSHNINTVQELLSVDLLDLSLPKPLIIQLEVLLNIVIAKRVLQPSARLLSIPRDHLDMHPKHYTAPMLFDSRYQVTPLDTFGKSIGLSSGGPAFMKGSVGGVGGVIKKKLKTFDESKRLYSQAIHGQYDLIDNNPFVADMLLQDLPSPSSSSSDKIIKMKKQGISLWSQGTSSSSNGNGMESYLQLHSKSNPMTKTMITNEGNSIDNSGLNDNQNQFEQERLADHNKWSFVHTLPSSFTTSNNNNNNSTQEGTGKTLANTINTLPNPTNITNNSNKPTIMKKKYNNNRDNRSSSSSRKEKMKETEGKEKKDYIYHNKDSCTLRPHDIFQGNYTCPHQHCHQVFSRLYTYNIHLKSHETFPQYHQYKRLPQLGYDTIPALSLPSITNAMNMQFADSIGQQQDHQMNSSIIEDGNSV